MFSLSTDQPTPVPHIDMYIISAKSWNDFGAKHPSKSCPPFQAWRPGGEGGGSPRSVSVSAPWRRTETRGVRVRSTRGRCNRPLLSELGRRVATHSGCRAPFQFARIQTRSTPRSLDLTSARSPASVSQLTPDAKHLQKSRPYSRAQDLPKAGLTLARSVS